MTDIQTAGPIGTLIGPNKQYQVLQWENQDLVLHRKFVTFKSGLRQAVTSGYHLETEDPDLLARWERAAEQIRLAKAREDAEIAADLQELAHSLANQS